MLWELAFFLFGLSGWTLVNSVFLELPAFIPLHSPRIASQLALAVQMGNLAPLVLYIVELTRPDLPKTPLIFAVFALACLCSIGLISLFHARVALLLLTAVSGAVGGLFNVLNWPFVGQFGRTFTVLYSLGSGLSPALPGLLAGLQFQNTKTLFSVPVFFICIFGVIILSFLAFLFIWVFKKSFETSSRNSLLKNEETSDQVPQLVHGIYVLHAISCALNFSIPGLSFYAVSSFSNPNTWVNYFTISSLVGGCLARMLCFVVNVKGTSLFVFVLSFFLCSFFAFVIAFSAFASFGSYPNAVAVILLNGIFGFFFSFQNTLGFMTPNLLKLEEEKRSKVARNLAYLQQAGALIGTLTTFILTEFGILK